MKKKPLALLLLICIFSMVVVACGGNSLNSNTSEQGGGQLTVPAEYAGLTNPFAGQAEAVAAGEKIYKSNCASCHGDKGEGDGPAGVGLTPRPVNLSQVGPQLGDDFMFWRISEGGGMDPFNSAMPSWKTSLSKDQIWQVITYIRTLAIK